MAEAIAGHGQAERLQKPAARHLSRALRAAAEPNLYGLDSTPRLDSEGLASEASRCWKPPQRMPTAVCVAPKLRGSLGAATAGRSGRREGMRVAAEVADIGSRSTEPWSEASKELASTLVARVESSRSS